MDTTLMIDVSLGFMLTTVVFFALLLCGLVRIVWWLRVQASAILELHTRLDKFDNTLTALFDDHNTFQETTEKQLQLLSAICRAIDQAPTWNGTRR